MSNSTIISKPLNFYSKSIVSFNQAFLTLIIVAGVSFWVKLTVRRCNLEKIIPGRNVKLLNFTGSGPDMPTLNKGLRSNVAILQLIGAYMKLYAKNKVILVWCFYLPIIIMGKAEAVKQLLENSRATKKSMYYTCVKPMFGNSLVTSEGKKWKSLRRLMSPFFHFNNLLGYLPLFNIKSQKLVSSLQEQTSKEYINITPTISLCTEAIMNEAVLGIKENIKTQGYTSLLEAAFRSLEIIADRILYFRYWLDITFPFKEVGKQHKADLNLLHDHCQSAIRDRMKYFSNIKSVENKEKGIEKKEMKIILDMLLEHYIRTKEISMTEILEEVIAFVYEGYGTVAIGSSWAIYLIGLNKGVQNKIVEELGRIFGDDRERPVTMEDLNELKYMENVLKETQRLYPTVPILLRETVEEVNICGYTLPKGVQCAIPLYHLHRDEVEFPNPEKFDPDRFLPENSTKRHSHAYLPFSGGIRNCIGQRLANMIQKVILSHVLRNFTVESLDERDKLAPASEVVIKPRYDLRIKLSKRE